MQWTTVARATIEDQDPEIQNIIDEFDREYGDDSGLSFVDLPAQQAGDPEPERGTEPLQDEGEDAESEKK